MTRKRFSLLATAILSFGVAIGCGEEPRPTGTAANDTDLGSTPIVEPTGGPCDCDPYDEDSEVLWEDCSDFRAVPGMAPCYEVNCGPCTWLDEVPMQTCYLQKKKLYYQRCTIEFKCGGSQVPCLLTDYTKYTWKSQMGEVRVVPCGSGNPWADMFINGPDGVPNTGDEWANCPD